MASVTAARYGFVSTAWNLSFDLGIAVGGLGLGVVVAQSGFGGGAVVMVALILVATAAMALPVTRLSRAESALDGP